MVYAIFVSSAYLHVYYNRRMLSSIYNINDSQQVCFRDSNWYLLLWGIFWIFLADFHFFFHNLELRYFWSATLPVQVFTDIFIYVHAFTAISFMSNVNVFWQDYLQQNIFKVFCCRKSRLYSTHLWLMIFRFQSLNIFECSLFTVSLSILS